MASEQRPPLPTSGSPVAAGLVLLWAGLSAAVLGAMVGMAGVWIAGVLVATGVVTTWVIRAQLAGWQERMRQRVGSVRERLGDVGVALEGDEGEAWLRVEPSHARALDRALDALDGAPSAVARKLDELREERGGLAAVLDCLEEPVLVLDEAGVVLLANASTRRLLGDRSNVVRGKALVGAELEDVLPQPELGRIVGAAQRGGGESGETSGRAAARVRLAVDGALREHEAAAMRADGGRVVLVLRDVTELSRAVQLKTDFVANASHELRTPLASIRAAGETLEGLGGDDAPVVERMSRLIGQNVARLEEMVRDLLDLSRLEAPDFPVERVAVDTRELLDGMVAVFGDAGRERSVGLELDVGPGCDEIVTDRKLIELVLRNLIENAMKFAYEGTQVRVRVRSGEADRRGRVAVIFEVRDRGLGIPLEQQQRVFERYYQVDLARTGDSRTRGTGLGLAIVKHATLKLGGQVTLESEWRKGTRVRVELPGAIGAEAAATS